MKKTVAIVLILLFVLSLAACGKQKSVSEQIVGTWVLTESSDAELAECYGQEETFDAKGSCYTNGFPTGSYRVDGSVLAIEGGWGGEMLCTVTIDGDTMVIEDETGWRKYARGTAGLFFDMWKSDR